MMRLDSAFQPHLGTNYVPSPDEASQILQVVNSARSEIHDLDSEINKLQLQLDILHDKRSRILDFADQHQALISPARRLTEDVLTCIFLACLPEDQNPGMYAQDAPTLLTRICHSWRRVALSTPRLWAAFHVILPAIEQDQHPVPNELERQTELACRTINTRELLVNRWIELSGACPLSISMQELSEKHIPQVAVDVIEELRFNFIANTIIPLHERWYSLELYVSDDILEDLIQTVLGEGLQLTMLKELRIFRMSSRSVSSQLSFNDLLSILPLNAVSATFYDFSVQETKLKPVQWVNITELNLKLMFNTVDFTSSFLRQFPSLISLKLSTGGWRASRDDSDDVVLPNLTTLSLFTLLSPEAVAVTKQLRVPSLIDLELHVFAHGSDSDATANEVEAVLMSLLPDPNKLHKLTFPYLRRWTRNSRHLIQILRRLPSLKCLKLSSVDVTSHNRWDEQEDRDPRSEICSFLNDELLLAFMPNASRDYSDIVCPKLEEFDCGYEMLTEFSELTLKGLLIARKNAHLIDNDISPLRRVHMFINDYKRLDHLDLDEKVSLGEDSAIHFRRRPKGHVHYEWVRYVTDSEAYTEL